MSEIRIGISGWTYAPWRGIFFPKKLPQHQELHYAARQVRSIEINGTFYSLQRPSSYQTWCDDTPDDFLFAIKGPRFLTHLKRLKDIEVPLANFFASGVLKLNQKLGPFLWQFPPHFAFNPERFEAFFRLLPRDTEAAAALARGHDHHLKYGSWVTTDENRPLRHAVEIRHDSFKCEAFIALLRKYNVALVVADTAGKWPLMDDVTADFVYVRLHGDAELYVSGYTAEALDRWAEKIAAWHEGKNAPNAALAAPPAKSIASGRDVYVYFDNDVKTHAPFDAMSLAHRLELGAEPPRPFGAAEEMVPPPTARTRWPEYARSEPSPKPSTRVARQTPQPTKRRVRKSKRAIPTRRAQKQKTKLKG